MLQRLLKAFGFEACGRLETVCAHATSCCETSLAGEDTAVAYFSGSFHAGIRSAALESAANGLIPTQRYFHRLHHSTWTDPCSEMKQVHVTCTTSTSTRRQWQHLDHRGRNPIVLWRAGIGLQCGLHGTALNSTI